MRVHEEGGRAQGLRRGRRRAELAVGGDDGALAVAPAKRPAAAFDEVLLRLLLDERARSRRVAFEPRVDRLLHRGEGTVAPVVFGHVEADVRQGGPLRPFLPLQEHQLKAPLAVPPPGPTGYGRASV